MALSATPPQLALLGGTFDPIHLGHTIPAKAIAKWLSLTSVTLLPAHIPPHKARPKVCSATRVEMVKLVCQQDPLFKLDTRELNRNKPSYTVDTLFELKREQPNSQIFFLIGMDSLLSLTRWVRYREILSMCHIVVSTRPGYDLGQLPLETINLLDEFKSSKEHALSKPAGCILFAPTCEYDISSSTIREKLRAGVNADSLLPAEVSEYISANKLYLT